jgi:hypothetical protein
MAADNSFLRNTNAGINEQLMTAQQQLALAQALRGQSLQPVQAPGGQNGRISPLSVLAQALNGYTANQKMGGATHDLATAQAAQAQNQMAVMAQALRGGSPQAGASAPDQPLSSTPQASAPGAGASAPAVGASAPQDTGGVPDPTADPNWQHQALLENFGIAPTGTAGAYAKALMDRAAPTDQIKNDTWAGVTPQQRAGIATSTTMTPNQSRVQVGPNGQPALAMVAPDPDKNLQYKVGPNGQVSAAGVPGAPAAAAQMTGANATATADAGIRDVTLPNGSTVPVRAGPAAAAGGTQAGVGPATYTGGALSPQAVARLQAGAAQGDPDAKAALAAYQQAQPRLGADPTVQTARTNQQNALAEKWKPLNEAVSNAQTINARLDTIKDLATRASTGQFADRQQFVNSLLSLAGSEKATDAASAKALLDKNANQIVAQLGQGGLGTDAARSIISSAYPSSHMPGPAIAEAVDNLKAANAMQVAKAGVLQQHYLNNDPAAYQQAESQFNAVADPRVFQWYSIHDPAQQAAFAKRMAAQDPTFRDKVQALTKMGALK